MTSLRYAWRSLRKSPGFVTVAVLALGIGLGLSTTMFAVMDAVLNPYVAFDKPNDLYSVNWWFGRRNPMRPAELYRYLRDNTHSFEGVAATGWGSVATLQGADGEPIDVGMRVASPRWFTMTGVHVERGRAFTEADGEDVIMLSHELWTRIFGKRKQLQGATVTLNGKTLVVVGVLPRGTDRGSAWTPLPANIETTNVTAYLRPWVRLGAGVSREQADRELKLLAGRLTEQYHAREAPFSFELSPVVERREELKDIHKAMVGSALAVLLIACVNLAHLMLTRGLAKRRELALRLALGASRWAVVRQMFTECAIITVGGMAIGGLIALWGTDLLQNRMPPEVAWVGLVRPQLSWRVFALGGAAATLSAVLFGLLPAMRVAFNLNLDEPMKDDAGTTTGRVRYRYNPLVMAEVGLALVLMMGGGLLVRTLHELQREKADTNEDTLLRGWYYMQRSPDTTVHRSQPSLQSVLTTIAGVPGVLETAFMGGRNPPGGAVSGEQTEDSTHTITMQYYPVVSTTYLHVVGLPILRGRDFEPGDASGPGVAIIDALAAQHLYPGEEAVGRMLKLGSPPSNAPWVRIIGVARSPKSREGDARYAPQAQVWLAMRDTVLEAGFAIRAASTDPKIPAAIVRRLRQMSGFGVSVMPWDFSHRAEIASRGFLAKVFVTMGAVALGLSALGLYGVLAYAVTRRMREFAVRVALGADAKTLRKMVLHDGFVMLLGGIGVGAFFALATSRLLDSVLIAVLPSDVVSLVFCEVILIGAGLAAAAGPARRAARANPMDILRAV